jgi:hypothetical protein
MTPRSDPLSRLSDAVAELALKPHEVERNCEAAQQAIRELIDTATASRAVHDWSTNGSLGDDGDWFICEHCGDSTRFPEQYRRPCLAASIRARKITEE